MLIEISIFWISWLPYLCRLGTFLFASTRFLLCIAKNHIKVGKLV